MQSLALCALLRRLYPLFFFFFLFFYGCLHPEGKNNLLSLLSSQRPAESMLLAPINVGGAWQGGREVTDPNAAVCARAARGRKEPGRGRGRPAAQEPRVQGTFRLTVGASCGFLLRSPCSRLTQTQRTQNKTACTTQKEGTLLGQGGAEAASPVEAAEGEASPVFS